MISEPVFRRLFLQVTIIVTIQFLFMAGLFSYYQQKNFLQHEERELVQIATILEQSFPYALYENCQSGEFNKIPQDERLSRLNQQLQPILEEINQQRPGFGMGFYLNKYNIVAITPYDSKMLGRQTSEESLRVYNSGKMMVSQIGDDLTWNGKTILIANYPLKIHGETVGHVWASAPINVRSMALYWNVLISLIIALLTWLLIMAPIWREMTNCHTTLTEMIQQISEGKHEADKLLAVPELVPVLETVQSLKTNLEKEYQFNQRTYQDIARLDRLHTVGEMTAAVAHEIRNPMTVIMGYAQMMAQQAEGKQLEGFNVIIEELKNVNGIIEDFLSISREHQSSSIMQQLNDVIQALYPLLYVESVNRAININLSLDQNLPMVNIDAKEIRQVVLNLTRNAFDAMDSAGLLTISTSFIEKSQQVLLEIKDTGSGIPAEILENIFKPFYTTKEAGTGLGLSVCKSIIEQQNASILVESEIGVGTSFKILFPLP